MHNRITLIIDFFSPPFKKFMPINFFRYLSCGGLNVIFDWVLFFIFFHYIFNEQIVDFGIIAFKPHIAAFCLLFQLLYYRAFIYQNMLVSKLHPSRQNSVV
jgi:hypothetical protein